MATTLVPLAALARACKADGYTGSDTDHVAIKAYCADNAIDTIEYEGKDIKVSELDYAPAKKEPKKLRLVGETAAEPADDFAAKIDAVVADRLKRMGLNGSGFQPINPDKPAVSVKTGPERQYEDRIKDGSAVFSDYWTAKAVTDAFRAKAMLMTGNGATGLQIIKANNEIMSQKGYSSLTEQLGGALVPEGYDNSVIRLVKEYGVARKICRVVDMTTNEYNRPKVTSTSGLTVYYPNEGTAGTESTETWGRTQLKAKMGVVITKMSKQILADSAINLMEDTAREAARAIAKIEDNTLFNGTGVYASGSYIPGCLGITALNTATSTDSRTFNSTQTTPGAITISDLTAFMGLLPSYARNQRTAFHCSPEMSNILLTRLGASMGGVTFSEFAGFGADLMTVLGRPVITNNVMPTSAATSASTIICLFGDMSLAADFGSRQGVEIDVSDQRYWDESNLALKATVRHDINVHDLGGTSTQSPIVALIHD